MKVMLRTLKQKSQSGLLEVKKIAMSGNGWNTAYEHTQLSIQLDDVILELNFMLCKFLWKIWYKVTRSSTINNWEKGGLKIIDLDCMVKLLHLAWLKRIFNAQDSTWKNYLRYILKGYGGLFFFFKHQIGLQFYTELLQWWSEVYVSFCPLKDWRKILWNNKEICGHNTPIYFESGIIFVKDLLLHLNNTDSFRIIVNIKWIKQIFCFGLDFMPQLLKEYQGGLTFV